MDRKSAIYIGLCAAIMGVSYGFMAPAFFPFRVLWYYPVARHWAFEVRSTAVAIDWYGRSLLALFIGICAFAITYPAFRRFKAVSSNALGVWTMWALTSTLMAMSLYAYQLILRQPSPEPLPSWYVPK